MNEKGELSRNSWTPFWAAYSGLATGLQGCEPLIGP